MCAGEAALKEAQLELQLSSRKQAADLELVRDGLQQQQAVLVSQSCYSTFMSVRCIQYATAPADLMFNNRMLATHYSQPFRTF